jgi:tetratricopeptide (TPR) repeat protein
VISTLAVILALAAAPPPVPDRAQAYYHFSLAQQSRLAGEVEEALGEYRRALRLDPGSGALHTELARMLRESGRVPEALVEAEEAVRIEPSAADGHLVLAQVLQSYAEGEGGEAALKKAAAAYEQSLKLRPGDVLTVLTLAHVYGQLDQHDDAVRMWERYLEFDPGSFDGYIQLGAHQLARGDSAAAAAALQKALTVQPDSVRAHLALAEIYGRAQETDQAILNYRKALELEPRSIDVRVKLGELLLRARRYDETLAEADTILAADAQNRYALELQARAFRETRQFDRASAVVDRLLKADPSDLKASYLALTLAEARGDYAAAVALIDKILARNRTGEADGAGNDRVFLVHLGMAYQQLGRHRESADAFKRAAAIGEPDPALLGQQVDALLLAKDNDAALAAVREARAKHPLDRDLLALEANVLRAGGDLEGGRALIEALRKQAPGDATVLAQVADFHRRALEYPAAEATLREARALDPRNLRVLFQLGAVLERQKRHDEAEAAFREALAVEPRSAPILNYLGYMNADRNVRVAEAAELIQRALDIDPDNGAYMDSLGWALFRLDRVTEAEKYLRRAVVREPNAVVFDHLADVLRKRGLVAEAVENWRRALEAADDDQELDRVRVERKIREALAQRGQAGQDDHP